MNYKDIYNEKKHTAEQVASMIQDDWVCCTDLAAAMPVELLDALGKRSASGLVRNLRLNCSLDIEPMYALHEDAYPGITPVSWFSGNKMAKAVNAGRGDYMPCYYRDMPMLHRAFAPSDAFFARVCPMDEEGNMYVGLDGSYTYQQFEDAKHIFLEVNEHMPRAINGPKINISRVDALYESSRELPVFPPAELDEISKQIAGYITEEIPDGGCLQFGIGAVPEAVGYALKDKKHLGIHTELITDGLVSLIECGAVDNSMKELHRGKTVATLAFGSKRLYDYINNNPDFLLPPVDYVNSPEIISKNSRVMSVNAALEVDFYGQVCSESIGTTHVSGTGGQADYVRGAISSPGGKSFIAFPSTAMHGKISRIKPVLTPGAIVSTSKNDVDYIVTEYGIAKLRGKSLSERTKALISIAHPDFRDELMFEAKKRFIL